MALDRQTDSILQDYYSEIRHALGNRFEHADVFLYSGNSGPKFGIILRKLHRGLAFWQVSWLLRGAAVRRGRATRFRMSPHRINPRSAILRETDGWRTAIGVST